MSVSQLNFPIPAPYRSVEHTRASPLPGARPAPGPPAPAPPVHPGTRQEEDKHREEDRRDEPEHEDDDVVVSDGRAGHDSWETVP